MSDETQTNSPPADVRQTAGPDTVAAHDGEILRAIEDIKVLKAKYFYYLDTKQWDALRTVFWDDAAFDPDGEGAYTFDGVEGFIEGASRGLGRAISVHHGHTPIIEVHGDEATGLWAMTDYVEIQSDPRSGFVGYGHYHERYRRRNGEWRMTAWKLTRLRVDPLPRLASGG
jgi:hypothetical protein